MDFPKIVTKLPGPKAKRVIAQDEKYMSPSYTRSYPLVVGRARDCMVEDVDGNRFLDMTAGIAVVSTGHCHPKVVEAIRSQTEDFLHMSGTDFYYSAESELAARLSGLLPGRWKVFFSNSGTEAVEAAMKLARYHTKRQRIIAFAGAFHGRTYGSLSLTSSRPGQRMHFSPLVPGVTHSIFPNMYRPILACRKGRDLGQVYLDFLSEVVLKKIAPANEVAAIIIEPIQGEGGYIIPPKGFLKGLQRICNEQGILFVLDEVQSGMGRTGKMFAFQHFGAEPDIICLAKGIASGMPLGAMLAKAQLMDWPRGAHASTFGGNPVCCRAAIATLDLVEGGLMRNAATVGRRLIAGLGKLQRSVAIIGDVRGLGLMVGAEIVLDKKSKTPAPKLVDEIIQRCFYKGMLLLSCGESTVRFSPPLTIKRDHIDTALRIFGAVVKEVAKQAKRKH
ncbi:MAG: acetyl ornithine aminotransferase family protein [Planctomycetota bacterium]